MSDKVDAGAVLAAIARIAAASDESDVLEVLYEAKDLLRVQQAVFASFIRDDLSTESFRFLVAADAAWCLAYQRQWWYSNDAWLLYAAANSEPTSDSHIPIRTDHQRAARDLATQFGVKSAFIVPAPAAGGVSRVGVLMLGSSLEGHFDQDRTQLAVVKPLARSLAMELHEWWVRKTRGDLLASSRIGQDDLELLRFERAGLSTKEIARKLGTTAASVDSRFQRLNAKLGTPNRKATARLAMEYGLIDDSQSHVL